MLALIVVVIGAAAAGLISLPGYAGAAVASLAELACHWWFWVLAVLLWLFGLIPGTKDFAIRRMFHALDRMQRRDLGRWPRPSLEATVWLLLVTAFAGRLLGWWGV